MGWEKRGNYRIIPMRDKMGGLKICKANLSLAYIVSVTLRMLRGRSVLYPFARVR